MIDLRSANATDSSLIGQAVSGAYSTGANLANANLSETKSVVANSRGGNSVVAFDTFTKI